MITLKPRVAQALLLVASMTDFEGAILDKQTMKSRPETISP
jgi:hypothetical protein